MEWIGIAWPLVGGMILALGIQRLLIWWRQRSEPAELVLALLALSVSAVTVFELLSLRATTAAQFDAVLRWAQLPIASIFVLLVLLVRFRFRVGRRWLGITACVVELSTLVPNFFSGANITFRELTRIGSARLLGEKTTIIMGDLNPWWLLYLLGILLLLIYLFDAALVAWRRDGADDRRGAVVVCGVLITYLLMDTSWMTAASMGWLHVPYSVSTVVMACLLFVFAVFNERNERLRAAQESATQRAELTHLSRVSLLGEVTGSLAHELNQPLAAVLSNAQAALRFLDREVPDLGEVRDGLVAIVDNDKRAGDVIRRLRTMLRKSEVVYQDLDVNDAIQDVRQLLANDFLNRRVILELDLGPDLPLVKGDRVQLLQVLVNLAINGCDAMAQKDSDRRLGIRTARAADGAVEVTVSDTGHGIPANRMQEIFTPYFTTKPTGMGLGLPVCRTIIQAHRGTLWADSDGTHGATLHFTLPAATRP